jgi:hypothetical protein
METASNPSSPGSTHKKLSHGANRVARPSKPSDRIALLFQTFDMKRNSHSSSIGWRDRKKITILPKLLILQCYIDFLEQ